MACQCRNGWQPMQVLAAGLGLSRQGPSAAQGGISFQPVNVESDRGMFVPAYSVSTLLLKASATCTKVST